MKAIVIYYSETGNTQKLARAVAAGMECQAVSISDVPPQSVADYDAVCFCSPVQGWQPAPKMLEYIALLKPVAGKKAAMAFTKHLFGADSSAGKMRRKLEGKGYRVNGSYSCYGWSRLIANFGPRSFMRGHPDADELERATIFGEKFIQPRET
jgi:flavodoxin